MKIASAEVFPIRLPLTAVLTLPRGPSHTLDMGKRMTLVKLTDTNGCVRSKTGPSQRWPAEIFESCTSSIRHCLAPAISGHDIFDSAELNARTNTELALGFDPGQSSVRPVPPLETDQSQAFR